MKTKLEIGLIEGENLLKKSAVMLISNLGKTVAVITLIVATLVTFTDLSFADLGTESFKTSLVMLLLASYLMYFSLEDAGEKLAEESEEYKSMLSLYEDERKRIGGEEIEGLREFCLDYSKRELEYRRKNYVISNALPYEEFERYLDGKEVPRKNLRVYRKALRMRAVDLTPKMLLTREKESKKSELRNPESFKLLRLAGKLIPTTVCMTVTVSVILTAKSDLCAATVIEGILKLSTLPIVGFRGYANGYAYVRKSFIPWIETKKRLLEAYRKKKSDADT